MENLNENFSVLANKSPAKTATPTKSQPLLVKSFSTHVNGSKIVLKFKKLSENAMKPLRGSLYAAGYDLFRYLLLSF